MQDISSLNVGHLADTIIINNFDDMQIIKENAKLLHMETPDLIIYSFNIARYVESQRFPDLDELDIPDTVVNVFMDHAKV